MPRIVPNICGVCPSPHNLASTKALDDLYSVEPTPTAKLIRQLHFNAFYVEDHFIHFFFLSAPDFILGPDADPAERNIVGLIKKVGSLKDMDEKAANTVIDCAGTTVTPGLFDSHVHPVLGDFTPRQKQIDFFESEVHGGVTTSISAGEVHLPGSC